MAPKVPTYDLQPEMSAEEIKDRLIEELSLRSFEFGIVNFANPEMVGHTGVMDAAVKAIETVDKCLGPVVRIAIENGYQLLVTADHGNSEKMWNEEKGIPFTAHTTNPVYLIHIGSRVTKDMILRDGIGTLADVAPTILKQMGIPIPKSYDGVPFT